MRMYLALLSMLLSLGILGCGSSGLVNEVSGQQGPSTIPLVPLTTPTPAEPVSHIRVVNAVPSFEIPGDPDGPKGLQVLIDGGVVANELPFVGVTNYVELEPGEHSIEVRFLGVPIGRQAVTLSDGDVKTTAVLQNLPGLGRGPVRPQFLDETKFLLLDDDVTPSAGQLEARLVNIGPIESDISLLNSNEVSLLLPVSECQAGPYQVQDLSALEGTTTLVGVYTDREDSDSVNSVYETVEGSGENIVAAVASQVGVEGANLTLFMGILPLTNETLLFIVKDDLDEGDTSVRSQGTGVF